MSAYTSEFAEHGTLRHLAGVAEFPELVAGPWAAASTCDESEPLALCEPQMDGGSSPAPKVPFKIAEFLLGQSAPAQDGVELVPADEEPGTDSCAAVNVEKVDAELGSITLDVDLDTRRPRLAALALAFAGAVAFARHRRRRSGNDPVAKTADQSDFTLSDGGRSLGTHDEESRRSESENPVDQRPACATCRVGLSHVWVTCNSCSDALCFLDACREHHETVCSEIAR